MSELDTIRLDLPASYAALGVLGASLHAVVEGVEDVAERDITSYNIQLAANEIFTNIVGHAYAGVDVGRVAIAISLLAAPRRLLVELRDQGAQFDPVAVPAPSLEEAQVHGYGLFLVEQLMDEVVYQPLPDGNCWQLTKYL
jgi:serine/threonine-protein kinase RsbW